MISGSIGDVTDGVVDDTDVFAFHWTMAGDFAARYAAGNAERPDRDLFLLLYGYDRSAAGELLASGFATPGLSYPSLAVGDYLLDVVWAPDPGGDPQYSIAINGPTASPIQGLDPTPDSVPEPSTMILVASGLAVVVRRRRR